MAGYGFPDLLVRLYAEIARQAGVEDPQRRAAETLEQFSNHKVTPETTERLIERLKAR